MIISERPNSLITLVEDKGQKIAMKVISPSEWMTISLLEQSYKNVMDIQCPYMVKVLEVVKRYETITVKMEYLEGYTRMEYDDNEACETVLDICQHLADLGYVWLDASPINLLEKDGDIKMVDLDTIVKIEDLPKKLEEPNLLLTWYASRIIKLMSNGER